MILVKQIIGIISIIPLIFACSFYTSQDSINERLSQVQIDSLKIIECDSLINNMSQTNADTFAIIKTIPKNFEESLTVLDSMTHTRMKEWIRCLPDGKFSSYVHHGFGMYLRNNWGLWGDSELSRNLYKMGILHPDDMSGVILKS